jgi:CNT family concentrative nucleoside transporter
MLLWAATTAMAAERSLLPHETSLLERILSFCGLFALIGLCWVFSEQRSRLNWRPVVGGVLCQLALGLVLLSPAVSQVFYDVVNRGVARLTGFANEGSAFLFRSFVPHAITIGDTSVAQTGVSVPLVNIAFMVLPTIIFYSSLLSVLYHLGVMQAVVQVLARVMVRVLGTSGAESLSAAGNIFVGQTEAPLLVRPYVGRMTRSELMAVMTGGFATVAGGVMAVYVNALQGIPNIAGHLVMASILSAPASLAIAKTLVPEVDQPVTAGKVSLPVERTATNVLEAAANGARDGMELMLNVGAMLLAIVALTAMADWIVSFVPLGRCSGAWSVGYACAEGAREDLALQHLLGWTFAPLALLMGVPWSEVTVVGSLLGEKIVKTELVAYFSLDALTAPGQPAVLSERGSIIASYALCGFANFASIGIQLGGIGGMAKNQMPVLSALGLKAMLAGTLAACMTGCIAGMLL